MATIGEMLAARLGTTTTPPVRSAAPKKGLPNPCEDGIGKHAHGLVLVLGRAPATSLLENVLEAPYGRARRLNDIISAIDKARDHMTVGAWKEAEESARLEWDYHRAEDLNSEVSSVLEALSSGSYDAWVTEQESATRAPKWPVFDEQLFELESVTDFTDAKDKYAEDLLAWEAARTPLEIRKLEYPGFAALTRDLVSKWQKRNLVRSAKARSDMIREAALQYESQIIDRAEYFRRVGERTDAVVAVSYTARSWKEWRGCGEPPMPWSEVPTAVVERSLYLDTSTFKSPELEATGRAAVAELTRRFHLTAECAYLCKFKQNGDRSTIVYGGRVLEFPVNDDSVNRFTPKEPVPTGVVPVTPDPKGWLHLGDRSKAEGGTWMPPSVYRAVQLLNNSGSVVGEGLHVDEDAVYHYGRHETQNYPRIAWQAWHTWVVVGVDDELGAYLDALNLVYKFGATSYITESAWWIPAHGRKTSKGGIRLEYGVIGQEALVMVRGSTHSRGRHGIEGYDIEVAGNNRAIATQAYGSSHGGGQTASIVVGVIKEGTPLLLSDGRGVRLRSGKVEIVPGLTLGQETQK